MTTATAQIIRLPQQPAQRTQPAPLDATTESQIAAWMRARDAWLESKRRKSASQHTIDAYARDWTQFFHYTQKTPWAVSGMDAIKWQSHLDAEGLAATTINRKLAALSSFYTFVIDKFTFVGPDNVERSIYIDNYGNPRANPFKRPDRHRVEQYGNSKPIHPRTIRTALRKINRETLTGARDFALIITYLYTGRRSTEIAALRWADIRHGDDHRIYYKYVGKGAKRREKELPPPAWAAIRAFLRTTGRLETIQPDEYIFRPVYTNRAARLPNVDPNTLDPNRPISGSLINRIIKRRFVAAGCKPEDVHTHTLRHTAAALRYQDGAGDILKISEFLDHSSVAITQIYLSKQRNPIDDGWTAVEQQIMI